MKYVLILYCLIKLFQMERVRTINTQENEKVNFNISHSNEWYTI